MASAAHSSRRPTRTPGRLSRAVSANEPATEPPAKRRRFHPNNLDNHEDHHEGTGARHMNGGADLIYNGARTAPRSRSRREALADHNETPAVSRSAMRMRQRRERPQRYVPPASAPRPRYSSAAAAAAASQASDGYKPREERSWEDFHPDLDIDVGLMVYSADEIDGRTSWGDAKLQRTTLQPPAPDALVDGTADGLPAESTLEKTPEDGGSNGAAFGTPARRKPGRPPRRPESMLNGLGSPPAPRIVPLPTHNPKERLNLPKPSFRQMNHFLQYEEDQKENKVNYVDRPMAHLGYQESDRFELPSKVLLRLTESQQMEDEAEVSLRLESDGPVDSGQQAPVIGKVEYDMDEQDVAWLEDINEQRRVESIDAIRPAIFEITMTQIEKEYYALEKRIPKPQPRHAQTHRPRSSSQAAVNGDPNPPGDEPDSKCAICDDGDCENANAIIFCDGCDLAVHQECYGVPFIPEGQWFCRKCKEIGRGTPTCIFCPNVDGAFKQTNTLRWSHLLCAIWIPEVAIANMTFMEPITDVDKVPKGRWKLSCYICQQKMGACIQCSNKNCYQAFHVTCARRAKLYLKMKSQHQGGIDTTALKAFCDKHVSPEWRRVHDTDTATVEAKRWYRHAMKDRKWADSQVAALELGAPATEAMSGFLVGEGGGGAEDTIAVTKRRRNQPQKSSWRLPSGAPVVPVVVYNAVEAGLTRFTIRKRKEFVERACKYWTLKREARRGAALLKRLQLQLESFSSMEITRRNFAAMGPAGRPRLLRRIEFAEMLQADISHLTSLTARIKEREELRLQELELLRDMVDTVYFPLTPLLKPILQRAQKLDEKTRVFHVGLDLLSDRLRERFYISVTDFSNDLSRVLTQILLGHDSIDSVSVADLDDFHNQINEAQPGTAEHMALTQEQKDLKRLAKRIVKAVKEPLEVAFKKEAALRGREHEEAIRKLDAMGIFVSNNSRTVEGVDGEPQASDSMRPRQSPDNYHPAQENDVEMTDAPAASSFPAESRSDEAVIHLNISDETTKASIAILPADQIPCAVNKAASSTSSSSSNNPMVHLKHISERPTEPISPPISRSSSAPSVTTALPNNSALNNVTASQSVDTRHIDPTNIASESYNVFAHGGVPWYLAPFDPCGTTIHEERYTGRAVLRDMSEELSDMDEDTLTELAPPPQASLPSSALVNGPGLSPRHSIVAHPLGHASRSSRRTREFSVNPASPGHVSDMDDEDEDEISSVPLTQTQHLGGLLAGPPSQPIAPALRKPAKKKRSKRSFWSR